MKRFLLLGMTLALLAGCSSSKDQDTATTSTEPAAERLSKSAPLTETATPNKPATPEASSVEDEDLTKLRAELESLNSDLSRIKTDLNGGEAQRVATQDVVPDTQLSTPRALATDGVLDIPDSKEELIAKDISTVKGLRIGQHDDSTRLVIEITGEQVRKPDVTVSGKTLVIRLFYTNWPDAVQQLASIEDQLGVFKVSKEGDDTLVTGTLQQASTLKAQMVLPPVDTGGPRRLVVDLAPAN